MNVRIAPPAEDTPRHTAAGQPLAEIARQLLDHLAQTQTHLRVLVETGRAKLAAMRRADAGGLQQIASREAALLEAFLLHERSRAIIVAQLAQTLRQPELTRATLHTISELLPEPARSAIVARKHALAELAEALRRDNALAARVARDLQGHVRAVYAAMNEACRQSFGYGPAGNERHVDRDACVDAVG
ncbi:MAG: hypothetical protein CHACPFDD_02504 [Phycisphaerae bacterium]|nr:hypothetical protein [Phycisphaerae bacterium]